jgi:Fe-S cluster assembly protein SufD
LESLAHALNDGNNTLEPFFSPMNEHTPFFNLNTAFTADGAALHLASDTIVDAPIYLLFIATGKAGAIYPRNILIAEQGSRATVIEHYLGSADARNFTNAITQISVEDGATIEHCKLLQENNEAFHIGGTHAIQGADSHFDSHSFALGGRMMRSDITTRLEGPGSQCNFSGLYLVAGKQHVDHHTRIDHIATNCTSREHYRGVLEESARGVFNGKVIVRPGAQKTDAYQVNHNLLLSRQAEMDTKPQLEIFADDVKCAHGATVGQLDDDMVFYLRSRGINPDLGKALLIYGFANNVITLVRLPALRERLEQILIARLPQGISIKEML